MLGSQRAQCTSCSCRTPFHYHDGCQLSGYRIVIHDRKDKPPHHHVHLLIMSDGLLSWRRNLHLLAASEALRRVYLTILRSRDRSHISIPPRERRRRIQRPQTREYIIRRARPHQAGRLWLCEESLRTCVNLFNFFSPFNCFSSEFAPTQIYIKV